MKSLIRFAIAIVAAATSVFAISCTRLENKEDLSGGGKVFHASFETAGIPDVKTYLDSDHKMRWTEDDRISVFEGNTNNQQYCYSGQTGNASADFEKISSDSYSENKISSNYAVYPYLQDNKISKDEKLTVKLPSVQQYAAGSFGLGANTMVAVTNGTSDTFLSFKNLCGYLVIRLYGEGTVKRIFFKGNSGEKITGVATIAASYGQNPSVSMDQSASDEIILDCGDGVTLGTTSQTATEFWFCIPPVEFSKGFSITVTDTAGGVMEKSLSSSKIISRNTINSMSALKAEFSEQETPVPEIVDLGLSVKWASFNVGASKPEGYGGYYQWAGIQDVTDTNIYLDWDHSPYYSTSRNLYTKYLPLYRYESDSPDNKTVLDPEDDVAHVALGRKWRMPTIYEIKELEAECHIEHFTLNGVEGLKYTSEKPGYTDKWIFLPAAGFRIEDGLYGKGEVGWYWSSSLDSFTPILALGLNFWTPYLLTEYGRPRGRSVRPVYGDRVSVTDVSLNSTSLIFNDFGETYTLSETVSPSNAAEQSVRWSSSNTSVATVDQDGKITVVDEGNTTITVTTTDGEYTATCTVKVAFPDTRVVIETPDAVDLGLSVKWASFNLGATKPEGYGGYYQWAGLEEVSDKSIYLGPDHCPYHSGSDEMKGWTKYINNSSYGTVDNKKVLDLDDDVAHIELGGKWRMPTIKEFSELKTNCTWTWTNDYNGTGIPGRIVTSKVPGYTDKSIFLPAAGYRYHKNLNFDGSVGYYWSSSLCDYACSCAYGYYLSSGDVFLDFYARVYGHSVRPVYDEELRVTGVSLDPTSLNLNVGETSTLCATVTPSNAADKSVSWTSSDTGIATVDQSGKVTAVGAGSATITVRTTDGSHTATCSVKVKDSTSDNPLVGTSWTCSFSDEAKYNTIYVDITLTFDSQSTFVMTTDETNVVKEQDIYYDYDYNGDGKIDQNDCQHIDGKTEHNSYTENGTYKVDGSTLELFRSGWYEPIYGTISGNIITLHGDEDVVFRKK